MIEIFTDGSCRKNNYGGWGLAIFKDKQCIKIIRGEKKETTNNRMELSAIIAALELASTIFKEERVYIYSDSSYCVNIYNNWIIGWSMKNWTKSDGKEIENLDLIQKIFNYKMISFSNFSISKIKGHDGILGNEIADALSTNNQTKLAKIFKENNINIEKEIII